VVPFELRMLAFSVWNVAAFGIVLLVVALLWVESSARFEPGV
jgi:type IV secretory pathway TrbD component